MSSSPPSAYNFEQSDHLPSLYSTLHCFYQSNTLTDVIISCGVNSPPIYAHRLILAAGSRYFRRILMSVRTSSARPPVPVLFTNQIAHEDMLALVEFMYKGEIIVKQDRIESLRKAAAKLKITGFENFIRKPFNPHKQQEAEQEKAPEREVDQEEEEGIEDDDDDDNEYNYECCPDIMETCLEDDTPEDHKENIHTGEDDGRQAWKENDQDDDGDEDGSLIGQNATSLAQLMAQHGMLNKMQPGNHVCDICGKTYAWKSGLYKHRRKVHNVNNNAWDGDDHTLSMNFTSIQ